MLVVPCVALCPRRVFVGTLNYEFGARRIRQLRGVFGSNPLQKGTPSMDSKKYIGLYVHKESISIALGNGEGKIVMECVIETKASMILQFIDGLRGDLRVTFEGVT